jgi:hypothetical protein
MSAKDRLTALSAPIPILILFTIAFLVARRADVWGTIGLVVTILVSVIFVAQPGGAS